MLNKKYWKENGRKWLQKNTHTATRLKYRFSRLVKLILSSKYNFEVPITQIYVKKNIFHSEEIHELSEISTCGNF